jgi:peptidoglycan hydrolase CwlO-like protein
MAEKDIVKRLSDAVERLIADHERVSETCRQLTEERDRLLRDKRELEERVRELDKRLKSVDISSAMAQTTGGDVERARQRINSLLRELDRCIAALKHQEVQEDTEE